MGWRCVECHGGCRCDEFCPAPGWKVIHVRCKYKNIKGPLAHEAGAKAFKNSLIEGLVTDLMLTGGCDGGATALANATGAGFKAAFIQLVKEKTNRDISEAEVNSSLYICVK